MQFISSYLATKEFLNASRLSPSSFTRVRIFSFETLVLFIINLIRDSLQVEINNFTSNLKREHVTKQAFSKARKKLAPTTFQLLNEKFVSEFYTDNDINTFYGYRILAVDGLKIQLPPSKAMKKHYGCCESQYGEGMAMGLASTVFDVLNHVTIDALLAPYKTSERFLAEQHIEKVREAWPSVKCGEKIIKNLWLFDRGYPSILLFTKLTVVGEDFIFRCPKNFFGFDIDPTGAPADFMYTIKLFSSERDHELRSSLHEHFPDLPDDAVIQVRVVTLLLESGVMETLITSLFDSKIFTREVLATLYFLRWGTEENNKNFKCLAQIENFSGTSKIAVEQDFHATVFTCNVANMLAQEAFDEKNEAEEQKKKTQAMHDRSKPLSAATIASNSMAQKFSEEPLKQATEKQKHVSPADAPTQNPSNESYSEKTIAVHDNQDTVPNRKYQYAINKNIALGLVKNDLVEALISGQDLYTFCEQIKKKMARSVVPKRPEKKYPRRKKYPGQKYPTNCRTCM